MVVHVRTFDREKALEAILFIASKLRAPTLHSISKIFYLADKLHLQQYGRVICGDRYIAMEYGPVPSAVYDMMKVADNRERIDADWDELIQDAIGVVFGRNIKPKRNPDMEMLAESEVECLMATIKEHGAKSFGQLTDITHDDAWKATSENQPISLEAIARTLPNADEVVEHLHAH